MYTPALPLSAATLTPPVSAATLSTLQPVASVARQLGLSGERVRQLLRTGALPYVQTPLGRLIEPADVARLAAERRPHGR